ncbi:hypothetical protein EHH59_10020 [Neisseria meningitidis]|nr:hypothetical protein EHH59_10020 [Neisseria meningitidis]
MNLDSDFKCNTSVLVVGTDSRMLPHTGLFLLGKVALQMRIRRIPTCRRSILFGREQQTIFLFPIHWYADG